jgi:hypothetical protein
MPLVRNIHDVRLAHHLADIPFLTSRLNTVEFLVSFNSLFRQPSSAEAR